MNKQSQRCTEMDSAINFKNLKIKTKLFYQRKSKVKILKKIYSHYQKDSPYKLSFLYCFRLRILFDTSQLSKLTGPNKDEDKD